MFGGVMEHQDAQIPEDQHAHAVEMRRVPKSKRGQQRVEKILDAAAELFAQQGYEATTTNQIAAHVTTSIGSLYQFFPNKESILEALAVRYVGEMQALVTGVGAAYSGVSAAEMFILHADAVRNYLLHNPGFRAVFGVSYGSEALKVTTQALNTALMQYVEGELAKELPKLTPERQHSVAAMIMLLFDVIKLHLLGDDPALAPITEQVYTELKQMAQVYLESLM